MTEWFEHQLHHDGQLGHAAAQKDTHATGADGWFLDPPQYYQWDRRGLVFTRERTGARETDDGCGGGGEEGVDGGGGGGGWGGVVGPS